jgi:hypothetical protein
VTPQQFWLILGGFLTVVVGWFAAARIYVAVGERRNLSAVAVAAEPDPDDLDAKWAAWWHEYDLQFRGTALWAALHDPSDAWVRQYPGWQTDDEQVWADRLTDQEGVTLVTVADTQRLDKVDEKVAARAARATDRLVKRAGAGYAGIVDMWAQWIYARRRSELRIAAVLAKTKGWPPDWQRQLQVLIAQNAVARAPKAVPIR